MYILYEIKRGGYIPAGSRGKMLDLHWFHTDSTPIQPPLPAGAVVVYSSRFSLFAWLRRQITTCLEDIALLVRFHSSKSLKLTT